ncbi:MAG: hypothetical protein AAGG68_23430 [Bacteroidota bacterium]
MKQTELYQEIKPIEALKDVVHSFWMHRNTTDRPQQLTIVPDSYFKIVFVVQNGQIVQYFMTGLWIRENQFITPPNAINFGCRLKILAPEYLIQREIASILQDTRPLNLSYLHLNNFDLSSFEDIVEQWQTELLNIKSPKSITGNKLRLSQLLDKIGGELTAKEVSEQIFWTNRQINRYLNKYLGISLKRYLNIQKAYQSYIQIREGRFFPERFYFDRAHFVREIKKHTGEPPSRLYELQNDRFIQIKNIQQQ